VVTHDRLPAELEHVRATLEHTEAVGRQLIGLHLEDAEELAIRSDCHVRVVTGSIVTAGLDRRRINVRTEDGIVVDFRTG
jgi:hypothetical protein